jgi:C4-dicarboxylate-specific signal transduction histidine kinase
MQREHAEPEPLPTTAGDGADRHLRQQRVVAELGLATIVTTDLQEVLDTISRTGVETLEVPFLEIMERLEGEDALLLRAGAGWRDGLVGSIRIPTGLGSVAGFTLDADGPVVIEDLREETRLRPSDLLTAHGVVSSLTVVIRSRSGPWGVLGVHNDRPRSFSPDDVHFVQSLANLVTAALERQRMELELDRNRTELALRAAEARLGRSERLLSLGTLAAGLAHEINNPLSTILITAESARAELANGRSNGRLNEDLAVIMENAERCGDIVHRVLDFVGERRAEQTAEDVNEIVHAAVRLARTGTGPERTREHRVELDLADDLPRVPTGRADLEQALAKLVANAFEAAEDALTVSVATRAVERGVEITIHDDGPGIPPDARTRIFNPFFTTRRERGGVGLGLPLAHRLVADHGGTLDLDSSSAAGTTFRIVLPARRSEPDGED